MNIFYVKMAKLEIWGAVSIIKNKGMVYGMEGTATQNNTETAQKNNSGPENSNQINVSVKNKF